MDEIRQLYTIRAQWNAIQFSHHFDLKERKNGSVEDFINRWSI